MAVARDIGIVRIDPANPLFAIGHPVGGRAGPAGIYQCQRCEGEDVHLGDAVLPPCPHCRDENTLWRAVVVAKHLHTPAGRAA